METENKNKILQRMIKEKTGHYCLCLQVKSIYEIECIIDSFFNNYLSEKIQANDILCFLKNQAIYYLCDNEYEEYAESTLQKEFEFYNFNFEEYISKNY